MPQLDGRVFSRLEQYDALPSELKDEVSALVDYLTTSQRDVFGIHHANIIKTVRSVRAKPLTEKITAWLLQRESLTTAPAAATETAVVEQESTTVVEQETVVEEKPAATEETTTTETPAATAPPATEDETKAAAAEEAAKAKAKAAEEAAKAKEAALKAKEEAAAKAKADAEAAAARLAHAKKLLEALVLKGFVTPYKEGDRPVNAPETETFTFKDSELFIPIAPEVASEPAPTPTTAAAAPAASADASVSDVPEASASAAPAEATTTATTPTTVWDLVDGAVFAATLKRKAGFLAPLTQGKDVYVVVNARTKSVTFFESDLGREPILTFNVDGTSVAFDKSHFVHGVKVWHDTLTELLNAANKLEREALVHALLAIGLTYHEELSATVEKVETIYELSDTDIEGEEVSLAKYKGKVLLVVNVSSKCGLTPTNYPELVALHEKYSALGLEVLAFPCNQFMGQEPGTHEEIKEFVKQYNPKFAFFSKGDVNGVDARPVFAFLKHKLPATYIQWNFTKFLVDRNGKPAKRFGPMELPLSFEDEIVKLLNEEVAVEEAAAEAVAETAAVTATETVAEATTVTVAETVTETVAKTETATETVAEAPAVAEPTPEVAPVEEVKAVAPAAVEKPVEAEPVKVEEPKAEEPKVEEPKAEEPKVEEPKVEEPKAEEPKVEAAPAAPAAVVEEPKPAEPKAEVVVTTEAAAVVEPAPKVEEVAAEPSAPAQGFTPGNEPAVAP